MTDNLSEKEIISWIEQAIENEHFENYEIDLKGKSEKGSGVMGDIVFARVKGSRNDNSNKILDLVVKHCKENEEFRKIMPCKLAFQTEIYMYDTIFPRFYKFQLERNVKDIFEATPKCYKTWILENMEALVLENLRTQDYEVNARQKPLNVNHLKAVLKQYAKFHALSLAFKNQCQNEFECLSKGFRETIWTQYLLNNDLTDSWKLATKMALDIVQEKGCPDLYEKYRNFLNNGVINLFTELWNAEEPESVIIHGDSWCGNFMFQYEGDSRKTPSKLKIIDWQLSCLKSPAFDLAYFIYVSSSNEELKHMDELLEYYYTSLSSFLLELGSNPEQIFPLSTFKRHWKKYSSFAVLTMPLIWQYLLCEAEDALAFDELKDGEGMGNMLQSKVKDQDLYNDRLLAMLSQYFKV